MITHRQLHPTLDSPLARWLMVAAWMAMIFFFSAQSTLPSPPDALLDLIFKKSSHFAVYAGLAVLCWRALPAGRWAIAAAWLLAVLYAISDEIHQSFTPERHPQASDVLIDACGAAAGLIICWLVLRRFEPDRQ